MSMQTQNGAKNHILYAILIWNCLRNYAHKLNTTVYEVKHPIYDHATKMTLKFPMYAFQ